MVKVKRPTTSSIVREMISDKKEELLDVLADEPRETGRPKDIYKMENKEVSAVDVFLYVPPDTIPAAQLKRFLHLCDQMFIALDAKTITRPEIEEVAQYYRDRILLDELYKTIASSEGGLADSRAIISNLDSMSKQLEKRKENLQIRAKDRQEARKLTKQKTMMDILAEVDEQKVEEEMKKLAETLNKVAATTTSTEKYMEARIPEGYTVKDDPEA